MGGGTKSFLTNRAVPQGTWVGGSGLHGPPMAVDRNGRPLPVGKQELTWAARKIIYGSGVWEGGQAIL